MKEEQQDDPMAVQITVSFAGGRSYQFWCSVKQFEETAGLEALRALIRSADMQSQKENQS